MMLLKLALLATVVVGTVKSHEPRVPGGEEVEPHSVPAQVLLTRGGRLMCGGVVYDEVNVLTAAHCCRASNSFKVHGGVHYVNDFDENVQTIEVESQKEHEDYDHSLISNDVCIVHLEKPFVFNDYVQPAKFPEQDEPIEPYAMAFATGWGRISKEKASRRQFPDVLMGVEVPVLPDEECIEAHEDQSLQHDPATMVCAGTGEGMGTCNGDSGGPLSVDEVVVGLCSWSIKVGGQCSRLPDNYARVATYADWFEANKKVV